MQVRLKVKFYPINKKSFYLKDLLADLPYKSFAELLDYQAENRSNQTCLLYPDLSSDPLCYASATFAQVNAAANHLASRYAKHIDISSNSEKSIIVGLLANSSTDYLLTIYGLVKLGVVFFPLSIRNSKAALEHLIKTTGVSYLIVGPGQIHIELDGLTILPLEQVNWNVDDTFSDRIQKTDNDSLERLQMILHRYVKLFLM
jgi:acyl-CoA synthetase (AMP-forming)/AMP-acid ligase II